MPRWLWWGPLVVLTFVAGLFVFREGWIRANLSETDVINHFAAQYVAQTGGNAQMTDCMAEPGQQTGVWIVVQCQSDSGAAQFLVDRFGRLVEPRKLDVLEPET